MHPLNLVYSISERASTSAFVLGVNNEKGLEFLGFNGGKRGSV